MIVEKGLYKRVACFLCLLVVFSSCGRIAPNIATSDSGQVLSTPTARISVQTYKAGGEAVTPGPGYGLPGLLVYSTYRGIHFVGGTPLIDRLLVASSVGPNVSAVGFSPDGKWFAYYTGFAYEGYPYKLHLISASGEEIVTVPEYEIVPVQKGSHAGRWYVRWITNEYVMVGTFYPETIYDNEWVVGILNAFTGEWNDLAPGDLPNHNPTPHYPGTWAFSPNLKRVFSVSRQRQDDRTSVIWLVLWDVENQTRLWRDDRFYSSGFAYGNQNDAAWSADGSVLAFGGAETPKPTVRQLEQQGIYLLDQDGTQLRLVTNFSSSYETFSTYGLNWSPNGRYLAFMLLGRTAPEAEVTDHIYLYDLVSDRVIHLCQRQTSAGFLADSPVWSPDGRYLAYIDWKDSPQEVRLARVIDIYSGEVVTVAEDIGLLGGWGWSSVRP
jgi:WD40 repeat protein